MFLKLQLRNGLENKSFNYRDNLDEVAEGSNKAFYYNHTNLTREQRITYLKSWFGGLGKNSMVKPTITLDFGKNIFIGDNTIINSNVTIFDRASVTFGNNVMVGPNCAFYTSIHPLDITTRQSSLMIAKPIIIQDDVWIAGNVVVYPGVTIKKGSVIAAGSVITSDTISNGFYSGNPALLVKVIDQSEIDKKFKVNP